MDLPVNIPSAADHRSIDAAYLSWRAGRINVRESISRMLDSLEAELSASRAAAFKGQAMDHGVKVSPSSPWAFVSAELFKSDES